MTKTVTEKQLTGLPEVPDADDDESLDDYEPPVDIYRMFPSLTYYGHPRLDIGLNHRRRQKGGPKEHE
ncbi:MAG: hypothetical protein V7638_3887 [Acidobacteriota bacterium]|jgi:hypothetical protein